MSSGEVKEHGEQPIFEAHNFRLLAMPQHQRICSKTWLSTGIRILASLKTDVYRRIIGTVTAAKQSIPPPTP